MKNSRYNDDFYWYSGKKIKLDYLFEKIKLNEHSNNLIIENEKKTFHETKTNNLELTLKKKEKYNYDFTNISSNGSNVYFSENLVKYFKSIVTDNLKIIEPYDAELLVIMSLKKWMLYLLNQYIFKYNKHHQTDYFLLKSFDDIIFLLNDNYISQETLMNIILKENEINLKKLLEKREKNSNNFSDISYNYWDKKQENNVKKNTIHEFMYSSKEDVIMDDFF